MIEDLDELAEADKKVRPELDEENPWPRLEEGLKYYEMNQRRGSRSRKEKP